MATYTPNYNLSKPKPTDEYQDFLDSYGDNMDIIDNNLGGGGGGGGHTIVDPDGTDMPQENKLQFTGSVNVSDDAVNGMTVVDVEGGGNYYLNTIYSTEEKKIGYWTDGKPLYQKTWNFDSQLLLNSNTWTNTSIPNADIESIVNVLGHNYNSGKLAFFDLNATADSGSYVRVLQTRNSQSAVTGITLQYTKTTDTAELNPQTGGVIYLPTIYSEEEREIGVWTDGKPLYQKSIFIAQYSPKSAVQTFAHGVSNLEQGWVVEAVKFRNSESGGSGADDFSKNIIGQDVYGFVDTSNVVRGQVWGVDGTNIKVRNSGSNTTNTTYDCWVTIRYTKTTDTAGSGSWNTDGVPTHHYSTNEQVIGTWINGKPLYEVSISLASGITVGSYGHVTLPADSVVRDLFGVIYRNSYKSVDKFNGYINNGDIFCSIRSGNLEYYISNIFSGIEELDFTVQYTKTTD